MRIGYIVHTISYRAAVYIYTQPLLTVHNNNILCNNYNSNKKKPVRIMVAFGKTLSGQFYC